MFQWEKYYFNYYYNMHRFDANCYDLSNDIIPLEVT